ncbi:ATP-dependent RNA helicase, partial [Tulasnella sp. 419]
MLMLEELDDVQVQYELDPNDTSGKGKVVKFIMKDKHPDSKSQHSSKKSKSSTLAPLTDEFNAPELLPAWSSIHLHPSLHRSIHKLTFTTPTEIQKQAIPPALEGKDIIGIAETGSGKTLAYGLPILNYIFKNYHTQSQDNLIALILLPTRELALQVSSHLKALLPTHHPHIKITSIVGGLSIQKQKRLLSSNPHIIIATPGRLWDILGEEDELANKIRHSLRFLVLDEADRMIETGHFKELEAILKLTLRIREEDKQQLDPAFEGMNLVEDDSDHPPNDQLQTFVFSATLSKELQQNLKRRPKGNWKKHNSRKVASTLDDLLLKLDFRTSPPEMIDLSVPTHTLSTLTESKVLCVTAEKDLFLYYFLLRYPGRTLVFLGSIDGIRRLLPLLSLLGLEGRVWGLHGEMQQKQRLKNLD